VVIIMASLRPARCYRRWKRAYTRWAVRRPERNYIGGIPGLRIRRFRTGEPKDEYIYRYYLVCDSRLNIRENALEAARVAINRVLERKIGRGNYFFRLMVYPHHVLRENKQLTGAGADRLQKGMSKAFGKPVGRAYRAAPGDRIFEVWTAKPVDDIVKEAFRRGIMKLPGDYHMETEIRVKGGAAEGAAATA